MAIELKDLGKAMKDYATAQEWAQVIALSRTAVRCRDGARESLDKAFTLRNNWSKKSITIKTATIQSKEAEIFVRDKYLADQEEGGRRPAKEGGQPVPADIYAAAKIQLQKVIPRQWRKRQLVSRQGKANKALKGNKPFVARIFGENLGVYVRTTPKKFPVMLLYSLVRGARKIEKKPWYKNTVKRYYEKWLPIEYEKAIDEQVERYMRKHGVS